MQHFPPNRDAERRARRSRGDQSVAIPTTEEHREDDEPEATADWVAHIAAGRIEVR